MDLWYNLNMEKKLGILIKQYNEYCGNNINDYLTKGLNFDKVIKELDVLREKGESEKLQKYSSYFYSDQFIWGFIFADLSNLDLSKISAEHLKRIPFSTMTKWPPKDKLPQGFEPDKLMQTNSNEEFYKLNRMQKNNLTGKGVKVAYIDSPFDIGHEAYVGKNIQYHEMNKDNEYHFHGYAVADKLLKIAPDVELSFYGCGDGGDNPSKHVNKTIQRIKALQDIVNRVKQGEDICVVGLSTNMDVNVDMVKDETIKIKLKNKLVAVKNKLYNLGVKYVESGESMKDFDFCHKVDINKPVDDINNYSSRNYRINKDAVSIVEVDSTRPVPFTKNEYVYENALGCASWSIPQVVGLFALAKQMDNEITFEEFSQICKDTAKTNANGIKILDSVAMIKEVKYCKKIKEENNI